MNIYIYIVPASIFERLTWGIFETVEENSAMTRYNVCVKDYTRHVSVIQTVASHVFIIISQTRTRISSCAERLGVSKIKTKIAREIESF